MNVQLGRFKAAGTITWQGGKERVKGAVIKAQSSADPGQVRFISSDDDGDFEFTDLAEGSWIFTAYHEDSFPEQLEATALNMDISGLNLSLPRKMGTIDRRAGIWFFASLCVGLIILAALFILLHTIFPQPLTYLWGLEPWKYLEVLLWGLAGVLVNLILTSGSYLRWQRFYREGIILHVSQIVAVPVLALVFVLLLSLVKLEFSLTPENSITLDLSDPRVMAAFAFIISARPWGLWDFIQEKASTFMGQVKVPR
jgi:hypothetical protein